MTIISKKASTDFLGVALAARQRGFTWIVPVDDKSPLRNKWLKFNVTPTVTELNLMAAEFPNRDVGIVLKGHAGSVFVWDIDNTGVLERMESETGRKLPLTYTVQSRPDSAPHKMHAYFRQTEHFACLFPKQVYAGDYDLKGMGGGQVVAEGCVRRDTGEVRIGNGHPVITIPDWLTDWLKKDSGPLVAAMNAKKREAAKALVKSPNGIVTTGQRTLYLRNKASFSLRTAWAESSSSMRSPSYAKQTVRTERLGLRVRQAIRNSELSLTIRRSAKSESTRCTQGHKD